MTIKSICLPSHCSAPSVKHPSWVCGNQVIYRTLAWFNDARRHYLGIK